MDSSTVYLFFSEKNSRSKRAADQVLDPPASKRRKESEHLLDYQVDYLFQQTEGRAELQDVVTMLKLTLKIVKAGGRTKMTLWHLARLKELCPNDTKLVEAADMVSEWMEYRDILEK